MRILLTLLFLIIGTVAGQLDKFINELAPCALKCAITYIPESGCSLTDLSCVCNAKQLWVDMEHCAIANCTTREGLAAQTTAADACEWPTRDKGLEIAILGPVLTTVSFIFVVIRLIARRNGSGQLFGGDDIAIVLAWCAGAPLAGFDILYWKYGLGQDIWRVPLNDISDLLRFFYAGELVYLFSTVLVKVSLLLFFLRIFPNQLFRRLTKAMIGVCVAFAFAFFWPLTFQCSPVDYAWLRWDGTRQGSCINVYVGGFVHAAINMVLDIIILIMPLPLLYRLQLRYSWRQRSQLLVMFSFGIIVVVVCILRLNTLLTFGRSLNPTWDYMGAAVWSMIEVQVSIICACLPSAKVFFTRYIPSWLASTAKDSKRSHDPESQSGALTDTSKDRLTKPPSKVSVVNVKPTGQDETGFTELVDMDMKGGARTPAPVTVSRSRLPDHIATQYKKPSKKASEKSRSNTGPDGYSKPLSVRIAEEVELDTYGLVR